MVAWRLGKQGGPQRLVAANNAFHLRGMAAGLGHKSVPRIAFFIGLNQSNTTFVLSSLPA